MNKVLMYHSIGSVGRETGADLYSVSVEKFRQQVAFIKEVHGPQTTDHGKVLMTFDDGLEDNYTIAYPILKEFGLKAYFFLLVGRIGTTGYMNWEQVRRLKEGGMTIGSHGMTHRILTELSDNELDYELFTSKSKIEAKLKSPVEYFSLPRGFSNRKIIEKAKHAGYKKIFTSSCEDNNSFLVGRIPVKGSWEIDYFCKVLNNGLSLRDKTERFVLNSSKKILGAKTYDRLRTFILK